MTSRRYYAAAFGIAILTAALFAPVGRFSFCPIDDEDYITDNRLVRGGLSWRAAALAFTTIEPRTANWIPATWLSHMVDVSLFGYRPGPHHLMNVLIHSITAALLALVLRAMTGRAGPSLVVAALFAVHPLRVESVAWIAERKDVLAAFFWVLALAAWLGYARRPRRGRYLLAAGAVLLALLAKPMAVTLPLALLLLDFWPLNRSRAGARRLLLEKVPLFALAAGASLLAWEAQRQAAAFSLMDSRLLPLRVANALLSCVRYLGKLIWPEGLSPFYTYHQTQLVSWPVAAAALSLAAVTIAAWRLRHARPWVAVGWTWYLVTLLPVLGLIQVGSQPLADRYTYLPSIGVLVGCCWTIADLLPRGASFLGRHRGPLAGAAAVAVAVALAAATRTQLSHWRDGDAFFARALSIAPDHPELRALVESSRGLADAQQGRNDSAQEHFLAAVRALPSYADGWNSLGVMRILTGQVEAGEQDLRVALRLAPRDPKVHANLGLALGERGRTPEAESAFAAALALDPGNAETHLQYGDFLLRLGRPEAAATSFRTALRFDPRNARARSRLATLERTGTPADAAR